MKKVIISCLYCLIIQGIALTAFAFDPFDAYRTCEEARGEQEAQRLANICAELIGEGSPCLTIAPCDMIEQAITIECRKYPVEKRPADCVEFTGKQ